MAGRLHRSVGAPKARTHDGSPRMRVKVVAERVHRGWGEHCVTVQKEQVGPIVSPAPKVCRRSIATISWVNHDLHFGELQAHELGTAISRSVVHEHRRRGRSSCLANRSEAGQQVFARVVADHYHSHARHAGSLERNAR